MKYAVLTRDYNSAIPSLYYVKDRSDAQTVLNILKELENPSEDMTDDAYWEYSIMVWNNTINPLILDTEEVSRWDIDMGVYKDVEIINDIPVNIF